ncbi:MAG: hypothetical protein ACF8R9_14605 [Phycisphaerales bacterium JB054]
MPDRDSRSLSTRAVGEGMREAETFTADDFEPIGESLISTLTFSNGRTALAHAAQTSTIESEGLGGDAFVAAIAEFPMSGVSQADTVSLFSLNFDLLDSVPARLVWEISADAVINARAQVSLVGPEGLIVLDGVGEYSSDGDLYSEGVFEQELMPGSYWLQAMCAAGSVGINGVDGAYRAASWEFSFQVPGPGSALSMGLGALGLAMRRRR